MKLPRIYPITNTEISDLTHLEQIKLLIDGGAHLIQIREKKASSADFFEAAKLAVEIGNAANVRILINDRIDIALAVNAAGVHLGQNDLSPIHARKLLGDDAIIGYSTHSTSQAIEAAKFPVDYIAIGPIFATSTKEDPDEIVGIEGLRKVREAIGGFPLVAIGGISLENAPEVLEIADSIAIIGGILKNPIGITAAMSEFNNL